MCGITGVLSFNSEPVSSEILKKMTDAIRHRGPDGEGVYLNHPIAFGHRRLAIIDLSSAGKQPMISADGRFVISYNGEIYNFEELK
ncbi:MAG: asparagine synthetase B, partial [Bdellovibrionota bacterium]